ncbi:hypothetical protein Q7C36_013805 [Tachysurus vachellii]|uniref:Uncharacterized protein n=1 Tax=Tachysurus vachellii TaxID=175792 RepID=A0AA88MLZ8_TACVA|nr:hypothetical protein Q7C36_013805 [Tachysurus vachellii]
MLLVHLGSIEALLPLYSSLPASLRYSVLLALERGRAGNSARRRIHLCRITKKLVKHNRAIRRREEARNEQKQINGKISESNTNTVTLKSITRLKSRSPAKTDEVGTFSVSRRFLQVSLEASVAKRGHGRSNLAASAQSRGANCRGSSPVWWARGLDESVPGKAAFFTPGTNEIGAELCSSYERRGYITPS